jgi:hypothetical protein
VEPAFLPPCGSWRGNSRCELVSCLLRHVASLLRIGFEEARRSLEEREGMGDRHRHPFIPLALVIHRELAYQIAEQFRVLGKPLGLKDCIIVGGMGMGAERLRWALGVPAHPSHSVSPLPPLQTWWLRRWSSLGSHM